jgi:hypothetical protein
MIPKEYYILIFLVSIAAKLLYSVANGRKHATESLKSVWDYFWCLENYKASWLLNYRGGSFLLPDAQTYARNVRLEALALKCFQMVKKDFR